jgi:GTP-binding protein HflX
VPSSKNDSIQISTLLDNDRQQLKQLMETKVIGVMKDYHVEVPSTEGKLLSQLKNETILRELAFHEEKQLYICKGYTLVDHPIYGQLQKYKVKG